MFTKPPATQNGWVCGKRHVDPGGTVILQPASIPPQPLEKTFPFTPQPSVSMEPLAPLVKAFRSSNADGKSEQEYQEMATKASRLLARRAQNNYERIVDCSFSASELEEVELFERRHEIPPKLKRIVFPALKERIRLLSLALNPYHSPEKDTKTRYDAIIDNLVTLDESLKQVGLSIVSIWITQQPERADNYIECISYSRASCITKRLQQHASQFPAFLTACDIFFNDFSYTNSSLSDPSTNQKWDRITELTEKSISYIDPIIQWLEVPLLDLTKQDWELAIIPIESILSRILPPTRLNSTRYYDDTSLDSYDTKDSLFASDKTFGHFVRAAIPISRWMQIYFGKLCRPDNRRPLIFARPSMSMDDDRLKLLVKYTDQIEDSISAFAGLLTRYRPGRKEAVRVVADLLGGFIRASNVLEEYWDSLRDSNDPRVNQESIGDARRWLDCWTAAFFVAARNAMDVTAFEYTWPPVVKMEDSSLDIEMDVSADEDAAMDE
ncbi:hypothetical protein MJO28_009561 [Puccinia striiformis f. sp. tritici]|uniref:Uncharacterized protein n=3 Tax=Puccinia striiformis TaxID=27350 RepID=A0A0L0UV76_9BASI|nr:hypothetical protein Pst134EB_018476 [Puccinia striiformis f. sp. tritici]KAI7947653.1 hypothetical protein MJO28_009561 [Puccinia striiformis f. sp. tritici]KAI7950672.1 hypothetical protein MJO29_009346 [Puccinia striiformis f. sp. tritici]KNE90942.1 hypothetical protein PSTG_15637 [Puccinia striiformis f. sp. tritici PST-78]POW17362.1 hypothetical protein PSTT_00534 [Puccinia striiformis]